MQGMDDMKRHGGLVLDEMKLSSHLDMTASARIEGFVNLGQFTEEADQHTRADHGLVVMFQPFVGRWTQIIGNSMPAALAFLLNAFFFYFTVYQHKMKCLNSRKSVCFELAFGASAVAGQLGHCTKTVNLGSLKSRAQW